MVPGKLIPQQIPSLSNVEEISCGYHHFAVKTKNGDISFYQIDEDGFLQPVLNLSLKPEPNKMNFLFNENDEFYKKLMNNKDEKEKYARENYFMKKPKNYYCHKSQSYDSSLPMM